MTHEPVQPLRKPRRWVRWVGGLLIGIMLCGGMRFWVHFRNKRSDSAVARLREVADVMDVMATPFPWARFVPARFQSLVPRRRDPYLIVFRSGTQNPEQYLREIPTQSLSEVIFGKSNLTPKDLEVLNRFPSLSVLRVKDCQLAEGTLHGLRSLQNLPLLYELQVWKCQLSSKETIDYAKLPHLQYLHLTGSNAGDSILQGIADHPQLTWLYLDGTAITDNGLQDIRRLPRLRKLDLARTQVTVVGVRHLQQLPELRELVLDRCDLGDEALEPLSAFPQPLRWSAIGTRMKRQLSNDAPQRPL